MSTDKYEALINEVDRSLDNSFIREAQYFIWVFNMLV